MSFWNDLANAVNQPLASSQSHDLTKQDSSTNPQRLIQMGMDRLANRLDPNVTAQDKQHEAEILAAVTSWSYAVITLIIKRVTARKVGMHVKERKGEELVDILNHPFERLLQNPNPLMTGEYLRSYNYFWLLLRGEAFTFISTPAPGEGEPEELWPLPANLVTPLPKTLRRARGNSKRLVIDYSYQPTQNEKAMHLPGENIMHWMFPNPWDYFRGLSPLSAGYLPLVTDNEQAKWLRDWYSKNNARPATVISLPPEISDVEFEKAKNEIFSRYGAGGLFTAVTRGGDLDVEVLQQTIEQMKILDARRFTLGEVAAIYNVPAGLLSDEAISGKDRQALESQMAESVTQPLVDMEAGFYTTDVVIPYYADKDELVVRANHIVPRDIALQIQAYNSHSMDRTIFENRAQQNLPDLEASSVLDAIIRKIPVRLIDPLNKAGVLTTVASDNFDGGNVPPDMSNRGEAPTAATPSMVNAPAPQQVEDVEAMRTTGLPDLLTLPSPDAAVNAAVHTELGRWRKVALRLLEQHDDPLHRTFESDIIPPSVHEHIEAKLSGARSERAVKDIFGEWLDKYDSSVSYNGHKSEADVLEAAAKNIREAESVKAVDQEELDEVFQAYHDTVNMSASELEEWADNPCSKEASQDRSPIRRNLRLLRKKKEDWTQKDVDDANRTISFVSRMRGNEQGDDITIEVDGRERNCGSKRDISLRNWAYSPSKGSKTKAAPNELSVGDFVGWNSSGGRARGRIVEVERDGQIDVPDSDFTINGTEDDPAALIVVWRNDEETATMVGHRFSALRRIEALKVPA